MKIQITILILFLSLLFMHNELFSQNKSLTPIYDDVTATMVGDSVEVSFNLLVSKKALKRDNMMTIKPILSNVSSMRYLPAVEVYTRYSSLLERKHNFFNGIAKTGPVAQRAERGDTLFYKCRVAYEPWMNNNLLLSNLTTVTGCCNVVESSDILLKNISLNNISIEEATPVVEFVPVVPPVIPPVMVELKEKYTAIKDISEYKKGELVRDGSISLYFEQGSSEIDETHADNIESIRVLNEIATLSSRDSIFVLKKIVIGGYCSVEGSFAHNLKISERRAEALKEYLSRLISIELDVLDLTFEGEDWGGLYNMVKESDMQDRQAVLDIIDNVSIFEGREKDLMDLNGGAPYRYMQKNFFHNFRKAGFINFYYKVVK